MIITYAITGTKDLCKILTYLIKIIDPDDEILCYNDLYTSEPGTFQLLEKYPRVKTVWKNEITYEMCKGSYIFCIHSIEFPEERLLKNIKKIISYHNPEVISLPRINIMQGYTQHDLSNYKYHINPDTGWVNWPDYCDRIFLKNSDSQHPNRVLLSPDKKNALICVIHA